MIQVTLELYGAFRQYSNGQKLVLSLVPGAGLRELKAELERMLSQRPESMSLAGLVQSSAIADERRVLDGAASFDQNITLAVLPPVCGG